MGKTVCCLIMSLTLIGCAKQATDIRSDQASLDRGRYLVQIGGCNDCHTPDYDVKAGNVDEKLWLTGVNVGWQGPWGTSYASNLRTHMQVLTEDQWLIEARTREMNYPMPWYLLQIMSEEDLRSIYRFVHSLGPAGEAAPTYLPPGIEPPLPVLRFVPAPGANP